MGYAETGEWGKKPLPADVDEAFREAIVNVHRYRVRVTDEEIRVDASAFVAIVSQIGMPDPLNQGAAAEARARAVLTRATAAMGDLNDEIGERLRELV